ncbi:MAG: hypothetical protein ACYC9Q_05275 [Bacillota bacterium]
MTVEEVHGGEKALEYHPDLDGFEPKDKGLVIRRYMSFAKYMSLLFSQCLYFCPADKLGDVFEGTVPKPMQGTHLGPVIERNRHNILVSCWAMGEDESVALWEKYGCDGVAVESTFGQLEKAFPNELPDVYPAMVRYIDYPLHRDDDLYSSLVRFFVQKRKCYSDERELRLIIMDSRVDKKEGWSVRCDLSALVQRVITAPGASAWLFELTQRITEKCLPGAVVKRSSIDDRPGY